MEISDKDKEHLVSELEKLTGTRPLFYLKLKIALEVGVIRRFLFLQKI